MADQPTALRGRATEYEQYQDIIKTIKASHQLSLSLFHLKMIAKLERTQSNACQNKDQTHNPQQTMGVT